MISTRPLTPEARPVAEPRDAPPGRALSFLAVENDDTTTTNINHDNDNDNDNTNNDNNND